MRLSNLETLRHVPVSSDLVAQFLVKSVIDCINLQMPLSARGTADFDSSLLLNGAENPSSIWWGLQGSSCRKNTSIQLTWQRYTFMPSYFTGDISITPSKSSRESIYFHLWPSVFAAPIKRYIWNIFAVSFWVSSPGAHSIYPYFWRFYVFIIPQLGS